MFFVLGREVVIIGLGCGGRGGVRGEEVVAGIPESCCRWRVGAGG